jgi:hypothetical protein
MRLPRTECPVCERDVAITSRKDRPRLYRHDPPLRDPELRSCPGSLKVVNMASGGMLALFDVALAESENDPEQEELF